MLPACLCAPWALLTIGTRLVLAGRPFVQPTSGIRPFLLTSLSSAWVPVPAAPVWQDLSGRGLAARSWSFVARVAVNQSSWKSVLSLGPRSHSLLPTPATIDEMGSAAQRKKVWGFSPFCVQASRPGTLLDPYMPCAILEFILESRAVLAERSFLSTSNPVYM